MEEDRQRWNSRFEEDAGYIMGTAPAPFLVETIQRILQIVPGRRTLDIACGEGRNSVFLARHGFEVTGVDISDRGIEKAQRLAAEEHVPVRYLREDLDEWEPDSPYDLIVNINYLQRSLIPRMVAALSPGGIILYETLLNAPKQMAVHTRSHLLAPGELKQLFPRQHGTILLLEERFEDEVPNARLTFIRSN